MIEYQWVPDRRRAEFLVEARDSETGELMERIGPVDADHADIIAWAMDSQRDIQVVWARSAISA